MGSVDSSYRTGPSKQYLYCSGALCCRAWKAVYFLDTTPPDCESVIVSPKNSYFLMRSTHAWTMLSSRLDAA
jgi:hypothetical protein